MVGAMVPAGVVLRVHSVFDRAINLEGASTGLLVSLVVRPEDMAATAVLVDHLFDGPVVGEPVMIGVPTGSGHSAAAKAGEGFSVRVACEGSTRWEGRLLGAPLDVDGLTAVVGRLQALVAGHGRDGGLLALVADATDTPVTRFAREALEIPGGPDWSRLVGLGIGLTPSGDDFLTGALLAEALLDARRVVPGGAAGWHGAIDRRAVAGRLEGTTAAGRTLLAAALEGRFPAYLLALIQATVEGRALAGHHLDHGHSSATDAACGIIARLRMKW